MQKPNNLGICVQKPNFLGNRYPTFLTVSYPKFWVSETQKCGYHLPKTLGN